MTAQAAAKRFVGLDLHKKYGVFTGVDREQKQLFGPTRVTVRGMRAWAEKNLSKSDHVVVEMTTNTWTVYDLLVDLVEEVIVVHPPHVALVTHAPVKTDSKAALTLAQLLAAGFLESIWIPDTYTRKLRALLAQRDKMVDIVTRTKNRLHARLHLWNIKPPTKRPFAPKHRDWWLSLSDDPVDRVCIQTDLDTLAYVKEQIKEVEKVLKQMAAQDERVLYLVQLPGVRYLSALVILAAIGDISRFPSARQLVGYAGLGARVYISGQKHSTGKLTKRGRKELRTALIQVAHHAGSAHEHWQVRIGELTERMSYQQAVVAVARSLLVVIWHVLTKREADRFADPQKVARRFLAHVYDLGKKNRAEGVSGPEMVRQMLDTLGIGQEVTSIRWSPSKVFELPS